MDRVGVRMMPVHVDRPLGPGDDLVRYIVAAVDLEDGDVVVVASSVVSSIEGRAVELEGVMPGQEARRIAEQTGRDPRVVELGLGQARRTCTGRGLFITESEHGLVCANAGIDRSNAGAGRVLLLPEDPDLSADRLRRTLAERTGRRIGVVVSDSHGRALRNGCVGVALGTAGVRTVWDRTGEVDLFGRPLTSTRVAVADLLASAGNLVMGEAAESVPAVVIRGVDVPGDGSGSDLIRPPEERVFTADWAAVP